MSENGPAITDQDEHHATGARSVESSRPALARVSVGEDNDTKILADLDRVFTENLLSQTDVGDALAKDLVAANLSLPALAEIDQVFNSRLVERVPSRKEIEQLLSVDNIGDIAVDGMRLNDLLDTGITGTEERKMLKRGIIFLKRKMYAEAAEWWLLNRPDDLINSRLHLLLTLFLTLTYKLSGDEATTNATLAQVKSHRLFKQRK